MKPSNSMQANTLIENRLTELANTYQINILYACESGSRAWGFPSPDSDYDVRFIYAPPWIDYLALDEPKDVIDLPLEASPAGLLDIGGWDLLKTLRLARKSNPVIWEWLQSPICYRAWPIMQLQELRTILDPFFCTIAACHHYVSLCRNTMENELTGPQVKIKKYFYMLRPLLAAVWIERYHAVPPMELNPLLSLLDGQAAIKDCIDELLQAKQHTDEKIPINRLPVLDDFLTRELKRLQIAAKQLPAAKGDSATLQRLFHALLKVG